MKYIVKGQVQHNKRLYSLGELIELEPKHANRLLKLNRIEAVREGLDQLKREVNEVISRYGENGSQVLRWVDAEASETSKVEPDVAETSKPSKSETPKETSIAAETTKDKTDKKDA